MSQTPAQKTPAQRRRAVIPTIGCIVQYVLTAQDAEAINRRREDARHHMADHHLKSNGVQIHVGNPVCEGDTFPMVITRVWGDGEQAAVNGQVLLDGNDLYWATSRVVGDGVGTFRWPVRSNA